KNDWVEIELGDDTGWVTSEYIKKSPANMENNNDNTFEPPAKSKQAYDNEANEIPYDNNVSAKSIIISTSNTQIRNKPSTNGDIIYFAAKNETFTIISKKN